MTSWPYCLRCNAKHATKPVVLTYDQRNEQYTDAPIPKRYVGAIGLGFCATCAAVERAIHRASLRDAHVAAKGETDG